MEPITATAEQLEQPAPEGIAQSEVQEAARQLAIAHQSLASARFSPLLLERLERQSEILEAIYQQFRHTSGEELNYSHAAEWVLDNYYVIKQALRQVEQDLSPAYYRQLPKLDGEGLYRGLPRVYALAQQRIIQEAAQLDMGRFRRFLAAYQEVQPLTMGEVWAVPIMMRFGLLECLVQAAGRVTGIFTEVAELSPALHFTMPEVPDRNLIANSIMGLRLLDSENWQYFFEECSLVESILRQDPAALYGRMTFGTRDRYRKVVEEMALAAKQEEIAVAQTAIDLSRHACSGSTIAAAPSDGWEGLHLRPECHVGYVLIGRGRAGLEEALAYRPSWRQRWRRWMQRRALPLYLSVVFLLAALQLLLGAGYAAATGGGGWLVALVVLLGLIPALSLATSLINWAVSLLVKPLVLPKLNFEEGIPARCRTMVVVPALLTSLEEGRDLLEQLEQHYLRNPERHLGFALLTDFADAPQEEMAGDAVLLQQLEEELAALNRRYPGRPFYLFHRRRLYNPSERHWMGWERKRGKLHEFNRLLRGASDTSFAIMRGNLSNLRQVKYVITLDADTLLPPNAAQRLVGTIAHPLNGAQFDGHSGRVIGGYTVLQPRTEIQPVSAGRSLFTRVFGGDTGLDLYSLAVSDVYQDLFAEGIYVGKGIYDVDAFERSLSGHAPENSLLSHDLFEGVQGRAGLVTDIVLFEEYPPHFLVYVRRSHRWIRGDWQLLPWLGPRVPAARGRIKNDLPWLARWKIADNLRRSLLAPALLFFLVAGWLFLPGSPAVWTLAGLLIPAAALLTSAAVAFVRGLGSGAWRDLRRTLRDGALRWLLQIAFLPYEALLSLDAIVTTLWRLFVTRRDLLQWTTAAHTASLFGEEAGVEATVRQMIRSALLVGAVVLLILFWRPESLLVAAPILILWLLSGEIAQRISRPFEQDALTLNESERQRLRVLARRTWLFFEHYVGPEDHWLPPDHYQESPRGVVAHRTSPTNIGLYLLSVLAAYDLGYVGALNLALLLNFTMETLGKLERYRGHFLNWIDTQTLQPLPPRYISTVDSGNLAGCLLVLKQACLAMQHEPVWREERWLGLLDTIDVFQETIALLPLPEGGKGGADEENAGVAPMQAQLEHMRAQIVADLERPEAWPALILRLAEVEQPQLERQLLALLGEEGAFPQSPSPTWGEAGGVEIAQNWRLLLSRLRRHIQAMQRDVEVLSPWQRALQEAPRYLRNGEAPTSVQAAWQQLQEALPALPRLGGLLQVVEQAAPALRQLQKALHESGGGEAVAEEREMATAWCTRLGAHLANVRITAEQLQEQFAQLAGLAGDFVEEMGFSFLYDEQRQVFHIGYNQDSGRLDNNYYDLLASEARIASIVAIAKREVPLKHWLHLARPLTRLENGLALLSWSGTMFEYLMPPLFMNSFRGTLLEQSCRLIVEQQIAYGQGRDVPWGISESGFYAFDNARNYQYRAFGVPGTGFKRGLGEDLVIAPYASLLALPIRPRAVLANLDHLQQYDMMGVYGMYEALDFTPARLELGRKAAVVRSYMAHHQGMALLALADVLRGQKMVARFHAEPAVQGVELLLQERVPAEAPLETSQEETEQAAVPPPAGPEINADPWPIPLKTPMPQVHVLSNGRLSSLITNAGSGYLSSPDVTYTRWRPDSTLDDWGHWVYVQDLESGDLWSAGFQPARVPAESQEVQFYPHMAQFRRRDDDIALQMEVAVAPDDDVEIRRIHLFNDSDRPRRLRLTSYGEVVLTDLPSDRRHPAFAKLFVESAYHPEENLLSFRRRPRSAEEAPRFLGHMLITAEGDPLSRTYESDRAQFLGRGREAARPLALAGGEQWLGEASGSTLDPVMALGQEVSLAPRTSKELALLTLVANTEEDLLELARMYQRWPVVQRAMSQARTRAQQELRQLNMPVQELARIQELLSLLLYPHPALRAEPGALAANRRGQQGLWPYGISGDHPILLLRLEDESGTELLTAVLRAHRYWRRRGLLIDLVILNRQESSYGQPVQDGVMRTIRRLNSAAHLNQRGGIFVLRSDQVGSEEDILLRAAARVILDDRAGSLAEQLSGQIKQAATLPEFVPWFSADELVESMPSLDRPADLLFDNGYGGFSPDGREYIIYLRPEETTPAPWINVIANERFGFLVSESGGGFTWAGNSGENRLTTWRNDPVQDMPAEALYLRDEETAEIWTPTPLPAPGGEPYLVRHGAGYSAFEHHSRCLRQRLRLFAAPDAPVKVVQLRLENHSARPRRITATYYAEWVLGTDRNSTQPYVIPEYRPERRALLARNPYNTEFAPAVAFLAADREIHGLTADRAEFLGRLGSLREPAGLRRIGLSGRVEPGDDPAGVLQVHIDLPAGGSEEITFLLGQGANEAEALAIIERFQDAAQVEAAWEGVAAFWDDVLSTVTVETPDKALDLLLNRWLLYQALSCRLWGRSALYQSSGAYGFRDQLQDVMALVHAQPDLARSHLLRAAGHQFMAGDVLHWWHPSLRDTVSSSFAPAAESGSGVARGVRTRISDDLVWLPFVTAYYVRATGDAAVLDEMAPYLQGKPLAQGEEERYGQFERAPEGASLYDHCLQALARASTQGEHGLPLMGAGDWNDGMNRVGIEGKGESVWLAWFLAGTLRDFAWVARCRGDDKEAERLEDQAEAYRAAVEAQAWDGRWYRRAYYDDGTPLGAQQNKECRIDAISQSWGVLTGLAAPERAREAMSAVEAQLIREDARLLLLFTPPFDKTRKDPGYIKGYVPGIRENGGQYTHAALWTIWAFAQLGDADRAVALFELINPIYRADTAAKADHYKVEPYVISADVYGVAPHEGRGGWTWYTGSSGWMYRLGLEAILGLRREGETLRLCPRLPEAWPGFRMIYRYGRARYEIAVRRSAAAEEAEDVRVVLDGEVLAEEAIPLQDDGRRHQVQIWL